MIRNFKNSDSKLASSPASLVLRPISLHSDQYTRNFITHSPKNAWFPEIVSSHVLKGSMKPQATTKQIQNTKFVLNLIHLTTFKNMVYIQKHAT